jgi:hypothetical protein
MGERVKTSHLPSFLYREMNVGRVRNSGIERENGIDAVSLTELASWIENDGFPAVALDLLNQAGNGPALTTSSRTKHTAMSSEQLLGWKLNVNASASSFDCTDLKIDVVWPRRTLPDYECENFGAGQENAIADLRIN